MSTTAETTTIPEPTTWEPRGHPVRWAIGGLALVVAGFTASIWFGALTPRVDVQTAGWTSGAEHADEVVVVLQVTNEAHAATRVDAAGESLPGLELTATEAQPGDAEAIVLGRPMPAFDDPITIPPGGTVEIGLRYRVTDCARVPDDPPAVPIELHTVLGLTRTHDVDSFETDDTGAPLPWTDSMLSRIC
jgi:hypothetical protein